MQAGDGVGRRAREVRAQDVPGVPDGFAGVGALRPAAELDLGSGPDGGVFDFAGEEPGLGGDGEEEGDGGVGREEERVEGQVEGGAGGEECGGWSVDAEGLEDVSLERRGFGRARTGK